MCAYIYIKSFSQYQRNVKVQKRYCIISLYLVSYELKIMFRYVSTYNFKRHEVYSIIIENHDDHINNHKIKIIYSNYILCQYLNS
jgi:hypothetical protein